MLDRVFSFFYHHRVSQLAGIPGPVPKFPTGTMGDFIGRRIWEVCAEYGQKYGGISLAWFAGTPAVVLNDPALIGQVLDTDAASYYKDAPHDAVAPVITPGDLFIANGEEWQFLRRSSPLVSTVDPEWLTLQFGAIGTTVRNFVERMVGRTIDDLIVPLRELIFESISTAVWGQTFGEDVYADFLKMAHVGHRRMQEPPPLQKVPPLDPMFYLARGHWTDAFRQAADRAATENSNRESNDLLHRTLRSATPLSIEQLAEMLSSAVFFGGVFSTAAAVAFTLRYLGEDPDSLAGIQKELEERGPLGSGFDLSALESCEQLDRAIRESLRVSPPVPLFARNVLRDRIAVLGNHTLPANTFIVITNWLLHRDPSHWTDPEKYQPSRWAGAGAESDPYGSGYFFPFGRGPRACVGQSFALILAKLTLATLFSRVKVDLDLSQKAEEDFFFAVRHPRLRARFVPRYP